jgi:hypothetical protein
MNYLLRTAATRGGSAALRANLASPPFNVGSVTSLARSLGPGFSGFDFSPAAAAGARSFAATNAAAARTGFGPGHPGATASDAVAAATQLHQIHSNESLEASSVAGLEPRGRGRYVERYRRNQSTSAGSATAEASAAPPPPFTAAADAAGAAGAYTRSHFRST